MSLSIQQNYWRQVFHRWTRLEIKKFHISKFISKHLTIFSIRPINPRLRSFQFYRNIPTEISLNALIRWNDSKLSIRPPLRSLKRFVSFVSTVRVSTSSLMKTQVKNNKCLNVGCMTLSFLI